MYQPSTLPQAMISGMGTLIIAGIARCILFLLGWKLFDSVAIKRLTQYSRVVITFSHTSYFDFFFLLLYRAAHPRVMSKFRTLVKPQAFTYFGWFLTRIGAIPSTKREDGPGGACDRIRTELSTAFRFIFAISPKGTLNRATWRSGYYHIGRQLEAMFMPAGLDYERKIVVFHKPISSRYSEKEVCTYLQSNLGTIVPLYPDREVMPIRAHDSSARSAVNWYWFASIVTLILFVGTLISSRI